MADSTTVIAGITVPFTPLVQMAIEHVRTESPPWLFHHVMRSWLFAVKLAAAENDPEIDEETLALAAILHDVGLVSKYRTLERRFEVDGAAAALSFIRSHQGEGTPGTAEYHKNKLRDVLVWNAIALHTTPSVALHAPSEVSFCHRGIGIDFAGIGLDRLPNSKATAAAILEAFPRLDIKVELKECLCTLARTKPETTYDNFVAAFGEAYVDGYKASTEGVKQLVMALQMNPLDR